jgi:hypothetical protein
VSRRKLLLRAWLAVLGTGAIACAMPAAAQSDAAGASIEVSDRLHVTTLQPLSLAGPTTRTMVQPGSVVLASATIEIRGSSDQAYSVSLSRTVPGSTAVTVEELSAWSENASRNLSEAYPGRTNSAGRDVVRLSGKVHLPQEVTSRDATASMTLGLNYQ